MYLLFSKLFIALFNFIYIYLHIFYVNAMCFNIQRVQQLNKLQPFYSRRNCQIELRTFYVSDDLISP